jgi:hypothetical protein
VIAGHNLIAAMRNLRFRNASVQWLFTLGLSVLLVMLPFAVPLDGRPHADGLQFLGRFHSLLVHLPIGMLVLLPLLELAGTTRLALREATGFVLLLTLATGAIAFVFGILLAYGSGVMGATVTRHMWGGIALLMGVRTTPPDLSFAARNHLAYTYLDGPSGRFAHPWKRLPDSLYAWPGEGAVPIGICSY